jgi:hypothetical protein
MNNNFSFNDDQLINLYADLLLSTDKYQEPEK